MSALNKDGLPELAKLIKKQLPKGIAQFPEDQISTAPVRFMAAEIVREKLFLHLRQEVPYGIAVEVENWDEDPERTGDFKNRRGGGGGCGGVPVQGEGVVGSAR